MCMEQCAKLSRFCIFKCLSETTRCWNRRQVKICGVDTHGERWAQVYNAGLAPSGVYRSKGRAASQGVMWRIPWSWKLLAFECPTDAAHLTHSLCFENFRLVCSNPSCPLTDRICVSLISETTSHKRVVMSTAVCAPRDDAAAYCVF